MDTIDKHSLETSAMMQGDRVSLAALAMKPIMATIAPSGERARQALQLIAAWNGAADKDRPEPLIFNAFLGALHRISLIDKLGVPMDDTGPFDATTLISLVTEHPVWCDAPGKHDPLCRATLGRALDDALALLVRRDGPDMSQWKWGAEHIAVLTHKLYSHIPLLDRVSDLSVPASGDFYTLDRGGGFEFPEGKPFARTHGAGYRGLYDLSDPDKSRFMITTGQSGHIFSPHYGDLVPLWLNVKSITLAGRRRIWRKRGPRNSCLGRDSGGSPALGRQIEPRDSKKGRRRSASRYLTASRRAAPRDDPLVGSFLNAGVDGRGGALVESGEDRVGDLLAFDQVAVYMISSLSAGIAGVIETGWLGAVTTNLGAGMELQVIAAAVIGGANLAGGVGTAFGALIGSALIEVIRNSLGLLGISAFWQGTFVGCFIILAVSFDRIRNFRVDP